MYRLKYILYCFLIVVIPSQGFAATMMLSCSQRHQQASVPAHAGHHDSAKVSPHEAVQNTHNASTQSQAEKCSACAACCHNISIVHWTFPEPVVLTGLVLSLPPLDEPVSFITSTLERPPRTFLA